MDLTRPVAAIQLAAGVFFFVTMATQDLTSPVAAYHLAAGFLFGENGHRDLVKLFLGGVLWSGYSGKVL